MIRFDITLACSLIKDPCSDASSLRASLAEALAFVAQFKEADGDSYTPLRPLDACQFVQYRNARHGRAEIRIDGEMWWYVEGDPLGTVRFRLTTSDLERMLEACE